MQPVGQLDTFLQQPPRQPLVQLDALHVSVEQTLGQQSLLQPTPAIVKHSAAHVHRHSFANFLMTYILSKQWRFAARQARARLMYT